MDFFKMFWLLMFGSGTKIWIYSATNYFISFNHVVDHFDINYRKWGIILALSVNEGPFCQLKANCKIFQAQQISSIAS